MRLLPTIAMVLLLVSAGCEKESVQWAVPKRSPATQASLWFERAATLTDQLISEAESAHRSESSGILNERGLAVLLADLRGTKADRQLALRVLKLPPRKKPEIAKQQWWEFQLLAERAEILAIVQDPSAPAALKKAQRVAVETEAAFGGIMSADDQLVGLIVRRGGATSAWAKATDLSRTFILSTLHDLDDYTTRDELFNDWVSRISPESSGLQSAVRMQVKWGNLDKADEVARRATGSMMGLRARAFIANAHAQAHDSVRAQDAVKGMYAELNAVPQDRHSEALFLILRTAGEVDCSDVFRQAFADWKVLVTDSSRDNTAETWSYLGVLAAAAGCEEETGFCLDRTTMLQASLSEPAELAEAKLMIAAVYARKGDLTNAKRWFDDSLSSHRLDDYALSEGFSRYTTGLIESGRVKEGLAILDTLVPKESDRRAAYVAAARVEQRNGNFKEAWRLATRLPDSLRHARIRVYREIALELIDAGREADAVGLVETLPPLDQAAVSMCIAAARTGKPSFGSLQLYTLPEY